MLSKNKKGQGLSLNVIIIAALALIVLVVLVMVFTGRIGVFEKGVSKEGQAELIQMRIQYGACKPTAPAEAGFTTAYGQAQSVAEKDSAKTNFEEEISRCKELTDKPACESAGCKW